MEEQVWLTTTDDRAMLRFLGEKYSTRKMRLFLVGCGRAVWQSIPVPEWQEVLQVAEQYADSEVDGEVLQRAWRVAYGPYLAGEGNTRAALEANGVNLHEGLFEGMNWTHNICRTAVASDFGMHRLGSMTAPTGGAGKVPQSPDLLRDVIGNPFRPVAFDPRWRSEAAVGIAAKMYDDRDFRAMPILADALEEVGCNSADILSHCREPGVHVRGCWVVDLVLGKA